MNEEGSTPESVLSPPISRESATSRSRPSNVICRDYMRNVCTRSANDCRFAHPVRIISDASRDEVIIPGNDSALPLCRDYCRGGASSCNRPNCKFLHLSTQEQAVFLSTGNLPTRITLASASGLRLSAEVEALNGSVPRCRNFYRGSCSRGSNCRYLHVSDGSEARHSNGDGRRLSVNDGSVDDAPEIKRMRAGDNSDPFLASPNAASVASSRPSSAGCSQCSSLLQENRSIKRRLDALEDRILKLTAANEVLLEQNARFRSSASSRPDSQSSEAQHHSLSNPIERHIAPAPRVLSDTPSPEPVEPNPVSPPSPPPPPPPPARPVESQAQPHHIFTQQVQSVGNLVAATPSYVTPIQLQQVAGGSVSVAVPVASASTQVSSQSARGSVMPYYITQFTPAQTFTAQINNSNEQMVGQPAMAVAAAFNPLPTAVTPGPLPLAAAQATPGTPYNGTPAAGQLCHLRPASYHITPAQTVCINALQAAPNMSPVVRTLNGGETQPATSNPADQITTAIMQPL